MGIPIAECPLQSIARSVLDNCDTLKITTPRARAEAVAAALVASGISGARSAARLAERIVEPVKEVKHEYSPEVHLLR
jgi:hypothetical protein